MDRDNEPRHPPQRNIPGGWRRNEADGEDPQERGHDRWPPGQQNEDHMPQARRPPRNVGPRRTPQNDRQEPHANAQRPPRNVGPRRPPQNDKQEPHANAQRPPHNVRPRRPPQNDRQEPHANAQRPPHNVRPRRPPQNDRQEPHANAQRPPHNVRPRRPSPDDQEREEQPDQQNNRRGGRPGNQNRRNYHNEEADRGNDRNNRGMGFRLLQEIANTKGPEILSKLSQKSNLFENLINSKIEKDDFIVLVIKVVAKVCASAFEELKLKILLDVCNSEFIATLRNYLMDLPYVPAIEKRKNHMYWGNPTVFWADLICFCECIIMRSPSTALQKCRSLIDGTTKACLEGLNERHKFRLPEEDYLKWTQLRDQLVISEEEEERKVLQVERRRFNPDEASDPPEDFRQLSVLPTREDLVNEQPFLRPNIVRGKYASVEHYLDVQFRLLREDCVGPLRVGLLQYIKDPLKKKYDNIRVFSGVKLVEPYVSQNKVGILVKFDEKTIKRHQKINWAHNKRLLYGSLLLFTKNNFKDIVVATVIDRDAKVLSRGMIAVSFVNMANEIQSLHNHDTYIMVESGVYFEPYFHVLTALQDRGFPNQIAMSKYIIDVDPEPHSPAYLTNETTYAMELLPGYPPRKVRVLDKDTWPSMYELGINASQYEAYHLALTHEFAVIQGPPGTGKTFLGVKVAKTLLDNIVGIRLLVICFTNHALDQFLEAILPITESMVRIGGQSRNESLTKYNLMNLRRLQSDHKHYKLLYENKYVLKQAVSQLQCVQKALDKINNGVLSYKNISCFPEMQHLGLVYNPQDGDLIMQWLFENLEANEELGDFEHLEVNEKLGEDENDENQELPANAMDIDDDPNRMEFILDDMEFDVEDRVDYDDLSISFNVIEAQAELKRLKTIAKQKAKCDGDMYDPWEIQILSAKIKRFRNMAVLKQTNSTLKITDIPNPRQFSIAQRWSIYFSSVNKLTETLIKKIGPLQKAQETAKTAYEEVRMLTDLEVLGKAKVVGMTTSGAARLRKLIQSLAPKIVIVEEAAEVLEGHIVTALTRNCEHLILIGDHQQLRPSAASYRLAMEFNMEISLFERMINNGMHSRRLSVQHRMRPEIAALITPSIYQDLANHESVEAFPQVRGVEGNLHFLTHDFKERSVDDSSSKCNEEEADLVLGLANYLMQQGYEPEDITLLAAYSGQMFYMRKQRPMYKFLAKVKITVVDNYQGEESKIILLSLVRYNSDNKIGFLGTVNRVCVALSRAREGFYMFGNIYILKNNAEIWVKIAATLEKKGSLAPNLRLKCENHPEQITTIANARDFQKVPEGGCLQKCKHNLPCGHLCPLICHGYDRGHIQVVCPVECERIICELGHVCPLKCSDACLPCMIPIEKTLPCQHRMDVHCHLDPSDPTIKCKTIVTVKLPHCGHETKKRCHLNDMFISCHVPCVFRVDQCGHQCLRKCHVTDDPKHDRYKCEKPCAKAKKGCKADLMGDRGDHQCNKRCHETCDDCTVEVIKKRSGCKHSERVACLVDVDSLPCRKNCARALPCGHFCKKKCFETCGDCKQKVMKKIASCGHEAKVECDAEATHWECTHACQRSLPCGHACHGRCALPCRPDACVELVDQEFLSPCGHRVKLPCNVYRSYVDDRRSKELLLGYCREPCRKVLACEHDCAGSCGQCWQGRLHRPCASACRQTNICGHQCQEPCNQVCPPCKVPCEVKCPHTKCNKICGNPCTPCQEACQRACRHGRCTGRCGEPCTRPPCPEPCDELLRCGHPCRGLCGEPCPDICRLCRPEEFPKDFMGYDYEEDDRFIKFQDCTHVLDVDNTDSLMKADRETVSIRSCPYCRKPIVNTYRYKDLINDIFKKEINPIKEKIYGSKKKIMEKCQQLLQNANSFLQARESDLKGNQHWKRAFEMINNDVIRKLRKGKPHESLLQLEMYSIYFSILEMVAQCHREYTAATARTQALAEEYNNQVELVCSTLAANMRKLSRQQQMDIGNEIKRLHAIIQLAKIQSTDAYITTRSESQVVAGTQDARGAILTWRVYDEETALAALKKFEQVVKVSGVVSKQERDLIVKAIGLKAGHWFKCPNGHFYCIGECGGAMQESKCIECGARVGGRSHRLLGDNTHAKEMDGSAYPAWSELANNMANFRLD